MKYRTGKKPARNDYRTIRFGDLLTPQIPAPPPSSDSLGRMAATLGIKDHIRDLFPLYGNDVYGDCAVCAKWHLDTLSEGLLGRHTVAAEAVVIADYNRLSGGVDDGLVLLDVLTDWRKATVRPILGFAKVDPRNLTHVKQAINLFGALYVGMQMTAEAEAQFDAGKPWVPGTLQDDGHCVPALDYTPIGLLASTWGKFQPWTWAGWLQMVDECYIVLPAEAADPNFSPGFDSQKLLSLLPALAA